MKDEIIIRKAKLEDLNEIINLWSQFNKEHEKIIFSDIRTKPFEKKNKNLIKSMKKYLKKNISSKNSVIFIPTVNNKIIGFIILVIRKDAPILANKKIGSISDIFIKNEFRNKRISSQLFKESIKWFKSKKLKFISLNVNPNNPAYNIYKKWGFVELMITMKKEI